MANSADDISALAPEFVKLTKETLFADIWKRPGLSQSEKSLVTITALAALNRTEQIDYHLGYGLDNGLKKDEIVAAMTHLAFYAGWPAAMVGLTHFKKVLDERQSFSSDARANSKRAAKEGAQEKFLGGWRLVSLEEPGAEGKTHTTDATGSLVFTREGRMSVQVMYRNPEAVVTSDSVRYSQGGYEASFGKYEIDDEARNFSYQVEGAIVRNLIGQNQKRAFELLGSRLIIRSADPKERWRVTWEHC